MTTETPAATTTKHLTGQDIANQAPQGACAAVIAELHENESDSMSDYFGHKTIRRVLIGYRFTARESFPNMRKCAAGFAETAHMAPGRVLYRISIQHTRSLPGGRYYQGHLDPTAAGAIDESDAMEWRTGTLDEAEAVRKRVGDKLAALVFDDGRELAAEIRTESMEHRENYSMGGGNYLKAGSRDSSGWAVSCRDLKYLRNDDYLKFEAMPEPAKAKTKPEPGTEETARTPGAVGELIEDNAGYRITRRVHTKKGTTYYQAEINERLPREKWEALTNSAKTAGGWYSKTWNGIPGGWAFEDLADCIAWAAKNLDTEVAQGLPPRMIPDDERPQDFKPSSPAKCPERGCWYSPKCEYRGYWYSLQADAPVPYWLRGEPCLDDPQDFPDNTTDEPAEDADEPGEGSDGQERAIRQSDQATRLERQAETQEAKAVKLRGDRQENTPKRQRQGQSARIDANHAERVAVALRTVAAALRAGDCPARFANIKNAKDIDRVVKVELGSNGYYDVHEVHGKFYDNSDYAVSFRAWVAEKQHPDTSAKQEEQQKQDKIKDMENEVRFSDIPGFFPTPLPVIEKMLDLAQIETGMSVLEPGAGKGDIMQAVIDACPGAEVVGIEINLKLCDICRAKGLRVVNGDFTRLDTWAARAPGNEPYDRVLMNPPFESGQDMAHVQKAWMLVKPGGRLVAIMSPSAWAPNPTRKAIIEFQAWAESVGAEATPLPSGSFLKGFVSTGVGAYIVSIVKD